jgi:hypothetical protein
MNNRIVRVELRDRAICTARAEVLVVARIESRTPHLQVRGRLMGPRCAFASTVEVAYHLRQIPEQTGGAELQARIVIPEPSLWDPQSPFLYSGPIELWDQSGRLDMVQVRHGLRQFRPGPRGVVINGKSLAIRAKEMAQPCSDDAALALRKAGYNALIVPVDRKTTALWDVGDRLGFLVVGRLGAIDDDMLGHLAELGRHASCLGWISEVPVESLDGLFSAEAIEAFGPID